MIRVNDNLFINPARLAAAYYANGTYTALTTDGCFVNVNGDVFDAIASAIGNFKIDDTLYVNPDAVISLEFAQGKYILSLLNKRKLEVSAAQAEIIEAGSVSVETENITGLTTTQLNALKPGDKVLKKTGNMVHTYTVSYKEEGQGICLTYVDASLAETVSYDYVEGEWVYNSTDSTPLING